MRIFITGGAGYIGSHTSHLLSRAGHQVIVYDNLSSGQKSSLPAEVIFIEGDVTDKNRLNESFRSEKPDAVIHFAALIEVEESMREPLQYYQNNFYGTLCVLEACKNNKVTKIVFSSTAAVYGESSPDPVTESYATNPINPYGQSKLISEKMIQDFAKSNEQFRFAILRYFNVAGAQVDIKSGKATLKIGQFRERATHLVTLAARAAAGIVPKLKIFGTDYQTPDGTCVRDYIHIDDLAEAHLKALEYLENSQKSEVFNCGYGSGFSVEQVVQAMKKVTGVDFNVERVGRRSGDSALIIANSDKAKSLLAWKPQFNDLNLICRSAYDWELFRKNMR